MADFEPWGPMLAEPRRRKSKYIGGVVQNRTTEGTYDFGLKLLQKMGWQKGKGLGKDCQGMAECIRLKSNSDRRGLCFEERMLDHQRDFNDLLTSLNSESGTPSMDVDKSRGLPSLEQKSKGAKRHIHYKKFARGKDLSRCTLNDFEGIMGKHAAKESLEVIGLLPNLQKCKQNVTSCDDQNALNKLEPLREDTNKPMVLNNDTDLCNERKTSILEKKKKKEKKEREFCEEPVRNQLNGTDGCDGEYSVNRKKRCDRYELVDDDCTTPSEVLCGSRKRKECNEVNGEISYINAKKKKKEDKLFISKSLDNTVSVKKESTNNESSPFESTMSKDMCSEYRKKKKKKSRGKVLLENGELEFDKSVVEESTCTPAPYGQPVSETNIVHDEKNRSDERQLCSNVEQTSRKHKKKHRKGNDISFNENCTANKVNANEVFILDDSIDIVYEKIEQNKSSEPELLKQSKKKVKRKNRHTYIELGDEGSGVERTAVSGYLKTNTAEINRSYDENEEKVKLSAKKRKEKKMTDTSLISIFKVISQVTKKENDRVILIESEDTGTEMVDVKKKKKKHKRRDRSLHCENGIENSGENMITPANTPRCNDSKKSKKQKKQDCELGYKDTLGVQKVTYSEMSSEISETKHLKSKVQKETEHHKTESKTRQTDVHEEPTPSEQCSSNHHRKARKISQDSDVISDVISGFVGANLKDIKGYGNWK